MSREEPLQFKVVIPARYGSTRLPGKPLREIAGRPMIEHVHRRATESGADEVVVATDDPRIAERVSAFGAEAELTAADHQSGTDRIEEVVRKRGWGNDTIVVNLQGDEPAMPPDLLRQVAADMQRHTDASVTTLYAPIRSRGELFDPHVVKLVVDRDGYALYFSRAPIPWHRDEFLAGQGEELPAGVAFCRHIGLYAYRAGFLQRYVKWPTASLERAESLEQLRVLCNGERIHVSQALSEPGHGVDTESDLQRVAPLLETL